jgi:membrane protein
MGSILKNSTVIERLLWRHAPRELAPWQRPLLFAARTTYAITRDLLQGYMSLQAMSLVYTTLLSLVPLLAVSFSVLKGFGVHNQIEPMLLQALAPLGPQGKEIATRLIGYVDNTQVRVLGSVGLLLLLYSVITLISKIEQVFNYTWRIQERRPFRQRISQYLSVLLIGPVLLFAVVGTTASLGASTVLQKAAAIQPFGLVLEGLGQLLPYLLVTAAFTFLYVFVPNTSVRLRSALIGALVAALLWQGIGQLFAQFMAGSTRYTAIYSGLAILILFMIWIYIAWLILLTGASIAFYHQHPEYLASGAHDLRLSNRQRERLALVLAERVAGAHYGRSPPCTAEQLAHEIDMPLSNVERALRMLEDTEIVLRTAGTPARFVPAQAPEEIPLTKILAAVRSYGEGALSSRLLPPTPAVAAVERKLEAAAEATLSGISLRDLASSPTATEAEDRTAAQEEAGHGSQRERAGTV